MKVINFIIIIALITACNPQNENKEQPGSQPPAPETPSPINCYSYTSAADTITLKVVHVGQSITGTLEYSLKEKDKNKGTIQGVMKDNILVADYTFMSEGVQSVRQVAFKLEGNSFIEGYGESFSENEKMKFRNVDSLTFSSSFKLTEVPCQ